MRQTWIAPNICPVCGDHLIVTRLSCEQCGSSLEGSFEVVSSGQGERASLDDTLSSRRSGPLNSGTRANESRYGRLARLSDEQLEFVEVFLGCRGVIKNVEDMLGVSYPTVRARLGGVLETMGFGGEDEPSPAERRRIRREILSELAAGRIDADEAHELLARAHALVEDER